jgi:SpoVK/Ycf46/Vps4 family AAA+-type ATPase
MKKFVQYLDNKGLNDDYSIIISEINRNYTQYNVGPYVQWQNKYEVFPEQNLGPKEKKLIEIDVQNIGDLLRIVETHPYHPQCEYNIDLKALHCIYGELKQIQGMIGLSSLKTALVEQLLYFIQYLHVGKESDFKHTVLFGPPGTGKTEIAKIIGNMYSKLGILKNNVFKKVSRSDLVAGYLGQTAIKTQKVIESCLGGVLFIDEAYALGDQGQNDSFSKECVDTICEALSCHKESLMVIIAGYEHELKESFFNMNIGLESRFIWRFKMDPYSPIELKDIFVKKLVENEWATEEPNLVAWFEKRKDSFRNYGRDIENLITYSKISHGRRIYGKPQEERKKISMEDLEKGYQTFLKNKVIKPKNLTIQNMYI